jgi:hypothetical protein
LMSSSMSKMFLPKVSSVGPVRKKNFSPLSVSPGEEEVVCGVLCQFKGGMKSRQLSCKLGLRDSS